MASSKSIHEIILDDQFDFDQQFKEMQREYISEFPDKIAVIEKLVLKLESDNDPTDVMRGLMGRIHSVKGSSGSYSFDFLASLFHKLEDYLADIGKDLKNVKNKVTPILKFLDLAKEYANELENDNHSDQEYYKKLDGLFADKNKNLHKVLILENTSSIAKAYEQILKEQNVKASYVSDGLTALGRLLRENFDSFITVQESKLIDGANLISTIKRLKGPNQKIKTVLITSNSNFSPDSHYPADYHLIKRQDLFKNLDDIYKAILSESPRQVSTKKSVVTEKATNELNKVLFVDDDKDIQLMVQLGMKKLKGVEAKFSSNGTEALEELKTFIPDLIILDYVMPGMSGKDVIEIIKKDERLKDIPVVFMTAKSRGSEIKELLSFGAVGTISKPFNPNTLPNQIESIWSKIS